MTKSQTDLRVLRTKNLLRQSFVELLESEPLDRITVQQLTQLAEINRATFYLHYTSMDDFIEYFIDYVFYNLESIFYKYFEMNFTKEIERQFLEELLEHIATKESLFKSLLVSKSIPYFTKLFVELIEKIMRKRDLDEKHADASYRSLAIDQDILSWYVSTSLIGMISMWLGSGLKYSPNYLAKQILKLNPFRKETD